MEWNFLAMTRLTTMTKVIKTITVKRMRTAAKVAPETSQAISQKKAAIRHPQVIQVTMITMGRLGPKLLRKSKQNQTRMTV